MGSNPGRTQWAVGENLRLAAPCRPRHTHTEPPHYGTNTLPGGPTERVQTGSESGGSAQRQLPLLPPVPTLSPPRISLPSSDPKRGHFDFFFFKGKRMSIVPTLKEEMDTGKCHSARAPPQITQPLLREPTRFSSVAPGRTWRQGQPGGRHLCRRSWGSFPGTLWRFLELGALPPTSHSDPPACTAPVAPPLWPRPPPSRSGALSSIQTLRPSVRYLCPFGPR